ncbi:MAG: helix-turn-helix transcriptional regulator [Anaerolineae bacterium]|nr:helix-turn-helix transcriptional regulator [Anaerolineae bacterium]
MGSQAETEGYLPLSESTFFILLSLATSPKHGYAIMKDVQQLSRGRLHLSTGTLYGALKRLLEGGWITQIEEKSLPPTKRMRRAYALTAQGESILLAEIARLWELLQAAEERGFAKD